MTMPPATERLVRLVLLLPDDHGHPLWDSLADEAGDSEAGSLRWYVGDAVKQWPPAGPRNLATGVLEVFADPGEPTLRLIAQAILDDSDSTPPGAGAAWVSEARAAAVAVLAEEPPLEDLHARARQHWSLRT